VFYPPEPWSSFTNVQLHPFLFQEVVAGWVLALAVVPLVGRVVAAVPAAPAEPSRPVP